MDEVDVSRGATGPSLTLELVKLLELPTSFVVVEVPANEVAPELELVVVSKGATGPSLLVGVVLGASSIKTGPLSRYPAASKVEYFST